MSTKTDPERISDLESQVEGFRCLMQKLLDPERKLTVNLTIEEMVVYVGNKPDKPFKFETINTEGKIMYCALSEKNRDRKPFTFTEMLHDLQENGWPTNSKTLSNNLAGLCQKGFLIKANRKDGYRLPEKVNIVAVPSPT